MSYECDICGVNFEQFDDETLCPLCTTCEIARIIVGAPATPRYHKKGTLRTQ
jgi:hypothetical protein